MSTLFVISPILFPLLGMLINATRGKQLGERASGLVATVMVGASFLVSVILFVMVGDSPEHRITADLGFSWIKAGTLDVPMAFTIDGLNSTLMLIITGVGALIHWYSTAYMHGDERFHRYFVYLNLFISSMLVLVMANNFLLMFVGWELVGLCSYLLIGFWYTNIKNPEAGRKAFIANRIGDVAFVIGLMLIFKNFGSLTFDEVFRKVEENKELAAAAAGMITFMLFLGATGKSAQIPLYVWLPDAMAGPTPVSALIHAATMVTAGLYMMARAHPLFELAPGTQNFVAIIGALTALWAGLIALTQYDIKKVLAYSTVSQLGFMVAAAGLGAYVASQFHLFTHAFFKALLFLGAGSVIHGMEHFSHATHKHGVDPQDMRYMGGLKDRMPFTFFTFLVGSLALAGVPIFSGFFSKDEIMLAALNKNVLVFLILTVTAVLTAFYTGRQLIMVFFGAPRSPDADHAEEGSWSMRIPLIVLAVFAAFAGFFNLPLNSGGGLHKWLEPVLHETPEPFSFGIALLFTLLAIGALALAWRVYTRAYPSAESAEPLAKIPALYNFSQNKGYLDDFYGLLVKVFYGFSSVFAQVFDLGFIDRIVNEAGKLTSKISSKSRGLQTGFVRSYGLMMLVGALAVVAYMVVGAAR